MKSIFTLLLISISTCSWATHLMGGEITAKQIGLLEYEVKLVLYRDMAGIDMSSDQEYFVYDQLGNLVGNYSFNFDSQNSGQQVQNFPYAVEPYYFYDELTLPQDGIYSIVFDHCCRNGAILNLTYPLQETMYLKTVVSTFTNSHNSTPEFLAPPVVYLPVMFPWQYNPLPYDSDGDSLHWSIVEVRGKIGSVPTTASAACTGWQLPASIPNNPFSIDAQTGVISWTASTLGNFVASVFVEEYRNGIKIGEIRRDMQFIVVPDDGNGVPTITGDETSNMNLQGNPQINLIPGEPLTINLVGENPDQYWSPMQLHAYGEPLLLDDNAAEFMVTNTSTLNRIEGVFTWTPDSSHIRKRPYIVNFRVSDDRWSFDKTLLIGINKKKLPVTYDDRELYLYPNPAKDRLTLLFSSDRRTEFTMELMDIQGRLIEFQENLYAETGNNLIPVQLQAPPGVYLVRIDLPGQIQLVRRLVIE